MAFCKNCGKELPPNAVFCSSCGANSGQFAPDAQPVQPTYAEPTEFTHEFSADETNDCRILAAIMYVLGLPGIILAVVLRQDSKFIKFHANQALILNIAAVLVTATAIVPILGWITAVVGDITLFVFMWIGFARALGGRACYLPVIGKYKIFDYKK